MEKDKLNEFKLFRFGNPGEEKPAVEFTNGISIDVSGYTSDYDDTFFKKGGIASLKSWLESDIKSCPKIEKIHRYGSCIARPSKIVAIGLNYKDHAHEAKLPIPTEPVVFLKAPSSLFGPNDPIILPENSKTLDWEAELGIVIGKKAYQISYDDAESYIAGFTVVNDVSERSYQMEHGGEWTKGKSMDSFCPTGPYLVPVENIKEYQKLPIRLTVNNELMQDSGTSKMIFDVQYVVSYLSRFMTLIPGDLNITGTPAGVGFGRTPAIYLKKNDRIVTEISGLGTLDQIVQ